MGGNAEKMTAGAKRGAQLSLADQHFENLKTKCPAKPPAQKSPVKPCRIKMANAYEGLKKMSSKGKTQAVVVEKRVPKAPPKPVKADAKKNDDPTKKQTPGCLLSSDQRVKALAAGDGKHNGKNWVIAGKHHRSGGPAQRQAPRSPDDSPQRSQRQTAGAGGKRQTFVYEYSR